MITVSESFLPIALLDELVITAPGIHCVAIWSDVARKYLNLNTRNRMVRKFDVRKIKEQILAGEWQNNHPHPIIFSKDGQLLDGQHRLLAIEAANIDMENAVLIRVETGATPSIREYIDTGSPRSLSDRIEFVQNQRENKIVSQLCNFWAKKVIFKPCPSPEVAHVFFEKHGLAAEAIARLKKKDKGIGSISVAFAAMEYYEIDKDKAEVFYEAIGTTDSNVQQARQLRDWLLRSGYLIGKQLGGETSRTYIYSRAVGCMKAHLEGRDVKIIRPASWE